MVVVPARIPLTTPVADDTVATPVLLLLQLPNGVLLARDDVPLIQVFVVPVIADGSGLTVTIDVVIQPVGSVYVIVVVPAARPVTTPEVLMVAAVVLLLLHVPPPVFVSVVVKPAHTFMVPPVTDGEGLTVTTVVAIQPVASA